MSFALVIAALLAAAFAAFMLLKPRRDASQARPLKAIDQRAGPRRQEVPPASSPVAQTQTAGPASAMPAELTGLQLLEVQALPAARLQALLTELRSLPRPPRALHQLVSPEFLGKASSAELSELVMGEPVVAARVVATVNSPFYGLQRPVSSIGQAVTFLGLNSVRGICLQYMLDESFKAGDPALKKHFDDLWRASSIASELCLNLAQKLQLAEPGVLATQLVLSFLGRFASATLLQRQGLSPQPGAGLLARSQLEQEKLGLSAGEIGFVLLQDWTLPAPIIEDVRAIDRILVTPAEALERSRGARLALCYLCARLGERIVQGQLTDLSGFDPLAEDGADFFQLRSHLAQPALSRLPELLRAPDLVRTLSRMLAPA